MNAHFNYVCEHCGLPISVKFCPIQTHNIGSSAYESCPFLLDHMCTPKSVDQSTSKMCCITVFKLKIIWHPGGHPNVAGSKIIASRPTKWHL